MPVGQKASRTLEIIDAHAHLGSKATEQTRPILVSADELVASMDKNGISKALVIARAESGTSNARLMSDLKPHRTRLFAIAEVGPGTEHADAQLDFLWPLLEDGVIRGFKLYPGNTKCHSFDKRLHKYLESLEDAGRPVIVHTGDCLCRVPGSDLAFVKARSVEILATMMPELKIVMAHAGAPHIADTVKACLEHPNVSVDCSGFMRTRTDDEDDSETACDTRWLLTCLMQLLEAIGPERILFGTDFPIARHMPYIKAMNGMPITADKLALIMSGNAKRIFGL